MKYSLGKVLQSDEDVTLVVQGGGMRGVYSVAVLNELFRLGYGQRFGEVIGTSAGALNSSYFLAGQPEDGVFIYTELLSGKRFINFNFFKRRVLDIDHLVDDIILNQVPLNEKALLGSHSRLWLALTTLSGETVWRSQNEPWPVSETLRAAAAMPIAYGKEIELGGQRYLDGGINESLGLSYALTRPARNILLVTTRPLEHGVGESGRLEKSAVRFLGQLARHPQEVTDKIVAPDRSLARAHQLVHSPARVWAISPSERIVSRLTRSKNKLVRAARLAERDTRRALLL